MRNTLSSMARISISLMLFAVTLSIAQIPFAHEASAIGLGWSQGGPAKKRLVDVSASNDGVIAYATENRRMRFCARFGNQLMVESTGANSQMRRALRGGPSQSVAMAKSSLRCHGLALITVFINQLTRVLLGPWLTRHRIN